MNRGHVPPSMRLTTYQWRNTGPPHPATSALTSRADRPNRPCGSIHDAAVSALRPPF